MNKLSKAEALYAKMEAQRELLNAEAERVYNETGKLNSPALFELAEKFDEIAGEYKQAIEEYETAWLKDLKETEK